LGITFKIIIYIFIIECKKKSKGTNLEGRVKGKEAKKLLQFHSQSITAKRKSKTGGKKMASKTSM